MAALVALAVAGWRSSTWYGGAGGAAAADRAAVTFPIGTYTSCVEGRQTPDGNVFLNVAGFQAGAVLELSQSGTRVVASYLDQNGVTLSARFSPTTSASATLVEASKSIPGFASLCATGPGNQGRYPARMTVTSGAMTYDAGTVFMTLTGTLRVDAGSCAARKSPGRLWILCQDRRGGPLPAVSAGEAPAPLPAGHYSCSSQVQSHMHANGTNEYVGGGGSGRLTLTQHGTHVTAQYGGDPSLAGPLRLVASSSTTANAEANQVLMAPCMLPVEARRGRPPTPEALAVMAGSLTIHDSTLFLSFAGTMTARSSCPGTQVAGSVICTR